MRTRYISLDTILTMRKTIVFIQVVPHSYSQPRVNPLHLGYPLKRISFTPIVRVSDRQCENGRVTLPITHGLSLCLSDCLPASSIRPLSRPFTICTFLYQCVCVCVCLAFDSIPHSSSFFLLRVLYHFCLASLTGIIDFYDC